MLAPARRTDEGSEDDSYRCARGHAFGIHWPPPDRPVFDPDVAAALERAFIAVNASYRHLARRDGVRRDRAGGDGAKGDHARRDGARRDDALGDWLAAEREAQGGGGGG